MKDSPRASRKATGAAFAILILSATLTASQISEAQSRCSRPEDMAAGTQAVISEIASHSLAETELRATPIPELTDDLIFLDTGGKPDPGKMVFSVCFYEVTIPTYTLKGNSIESIHIQLDATHHWITAVDPEARQAYLLAGSTDPTAGFDKLIKTLHLQVNGSDFAMDVFDSYLKMARGKDFRSRVVTEDMRLESLSLDDFRMRFSPTKSRGTFERWWATVPLSVRQSLKSPTAVHTKNRFAIRYFFYDEGALWKQTVDVETDGTVSEEKPQIVIRGPSVTHR